MCMHINIQRYSPTTVFWLVDTSRNYGVHFLTNISVRKGMGWCTSSPI